jgi:membrane-associated phospholipid phosphatase
MNDLSPPDNTPREVWTWRRGVWQAVALAVIMFSSLGGYLLVLYWRGADARLTTWTALDEWIPFQPAWVWAYLIPYLIGPVAIGLLRPVTFRWFVSRGLVIVGLTLVIFILVPTQTANEHRQEYVGTGPTADLYRWMIEIDDPPANAAPSLHVSLTFLLAWALVRDFPRWRLVSFVAVGIVWLSTLFTRQHHIIDVVTGVMLSCAVVLCWPAHWRRAAVMEEEA